MAANTDTAPRTPTHAQLLDMAIEHEQGRLPENDLKSGKYSWAKTTVRTLKRWARKLRLMVEQRREERRQDLRHKNTPRSVAAADEIVVSVEDEHPTTVELRDVRSRVVPSQGGRPPKLDDAQKDLLLKFNDVASHGTAEPHGKSSFLTKARRMIAKINGKREEEVPQPSECFYKRAKASAKERGIDVREKKAKEISITRALAKAWHLDDVFFDMLDKVYADDFANHLITSQEPPAVAKYNCDEVGITPEGTYDVACTIAERDAEGKVVNIVFPSDVRVRSLCSIVDAWHVQ